MDNVKLANATACEYLRSIKFGCIDAATNWQRRENLAIIGTHDDQLLWIAAPNEDPMLVWISGHTDRCATGGDWTVRHNFRLLEIDDCYRVLVHQVDVHLTRGVRSQKFRRSAKLDRLLDLPIREGDIRLEGHENTPVARDHKNAVAVFVVNDSVRVGLGHDRAQHRVGLKIEDENRTLPAAVAAEPASHSPHDCHS